MAQILDPLPSDNKDRILCCYVNATSNIQVARITNIPDWYFERVVFPGQRLVFEALPSGLLEIHTGLMATAIFSDKIPCVRLSVEEKKPPSSGDSLTQQVTESVASKQSLGKVNNKNRLTSEFLTYAHIN
ncbi:DUF1830 domain-containing protein [Lyngbya aestuarii]|uniref:DUF1830 domain-containing protein n=1 Tax=Lyngbya aestuarii TaxID=118322 RepID=UPI00403D820D